jgi:hypothetical protein
MLEALEEIKPSETELEFLDLMGINLRKGDFLDENNDKFVYKKARSVVSNSKDGVLYEFKCGDTELSFFRDMEENKTIPNNNVTVIKNGNIYKAGELNCIEGYQQRWVEFNGDAPVKITSLPYPHCSVAGSFYCVMVEINNFYSTIQCLPSGIVRTNGYLKPSKVGLSDKEFELQYLHETSTHLEHDQDAKKFVDLVYPFIFKDYKNTLHIPYQFYQDFHRYWESRELDIRRKFSNEVASAMNTVELSKFHDIIKTAQANQEDELSTVLEESKALDSYVRNNLRIDSEIAHELYHEIPHHK